MTEGFGNNSEADLERGDHEHDRARGDGMLAPPVLKPCPFCGTRNQSVDAEGGVCCEGSIDYADGSVFECSAYATSREAWNTRTPDWQDISTAPKDGTRIMVFDPSYSKYPTPVFWSQDECEWLDAIGHFEFVRSTHWQPLPAPPKGNKQ